MCIYCVHRMAARGRQTRGKMEKLIAKCRTLNDAQILEAAMLLQNATKEHERMARAAVHEVYIEREGEDAYDALLDILGGE